MPQTTLDSKPEANGLFNLIRHAHQSKNPAPQSDSNLFFTMPTEVILMITDYFDSNDRRNFRLVCHVFDEIVSPRYFHTVIVWFHHSSLQRLQNLAGNSKNNKYVRCLHFEMDALETVPASFTRYSETQRHVHKAYQSEPLKDHRFIGGGLLPGETLTENDLKKIIQGLSKSSGYSDSA
jgi:hypothetical protein